MSSASAVAEFPEAIKRLFNQEELKPGQPVSVNYCVGGVFENILLDDYIPVDQTGKAKFTTSKNNCLWPVFLEKASAKVYGAFWHIGGAGAPSRALKDLTGAPNEFFSSKNYDPDELFDKIIEADNKKFIMVAPTYSDAS